MSMLFNISVISACKHHDYRFHISENEERVSDLRAHAGAGEVDGLKVTK